MSDEKQEITSALVNLAAVPLVSLLSLDRELLTSSLSHVERRTVAPEIPAHSEQLMMWVPFPSGQAGDPDQEHAER